MNENRPPAGSVPEFHPVPSDVDVWETTSVFVQVTVVPAVMSSWSGVKALFPSPSAPTGIVTDEVGPLGVGDGEGAGAGDEP